MPSYNLTATELRVLTTWLFEPSGYLDFAVRSSDSQTAREALAADPALDVTQWIRDNLQDDINQSNETAMVWWIRANDRVNISRPQRPVEFGSWTAILTGWSTSIDAALVRANLSERNSKSTDTVGEDGTVDGSIQSGAHLTHQQEIISAVNGVLI